MLLLITLSLPACGGKTANTEITETPQETKVETAKQGKAGVCFYSYSDTYTANVRRSLEGVAGIEVNNLSGDLICDFSRAIAQEKVAALLDPIQMGKSLYKLMYLLSNREEVTTENLNVEGAEVTGHSISLHYTAIKKDNPYQEARLWPLHSSLQSAGRDPFFGG